MVNQGEKSRKDEETKGTSKEKVPESEDETKQKIQKESVEGTSGKEEPKDEKIKRQEKGGDRPRRPRSRSASREITANKKRR